MKLAGYLSALLIAAAGAGASELDQLRGAGTDILPVDQAFRVDTLQEAEHFEVRWTMPKGYYLYRQAFEVTDGAGEFRPFRVPDGKAQFDEFFGDVEVYYDEVIVDIPLAGAEELSVRYQGCAEVGYCYPPQTRTFALSE